MEVEVRTDAALRMIAQIAGELLDAPRSLTFPYQLITIKSS